MGNRTASVGVIAFADFQCPYCAQFAQATLPKVAERYIDTGEVLFAFRHLPLERIHPAAVRAAAAAECGRVQGRFWEFHDRLFGAASQLGTLDMDRLGGEIGIDAKAYKACLERAGTENVRADLAAALALGITATPTFLFGVVDKDGRLVAKRREAGAMPFEAFAAIVDRVASEADIGRLRQVP